MLNGKPIVIYNGTIYHMKQNDDFSCKGCSFSKNNTSCTKLFKDGTGNALAASGMCIDFNCIFVEEIDIKLK